MGWHLKQNEKIRLLLTGGGTGGHVYPTLALYQLVKAEWPIGAVLYVGSRGRAEEKIVTAQGIPIKYIQSAPWSGLKPLSLGRSLLQILIGCLQSLAILLRFRPHLIIAAGGYVSAPITMASFLLRPLWSSLLVLAEPNLVPGLMNKVGSLFAHAVLVTFPETPFYMWNHRCVYVGYPVRESFTVRSDPDKARQALEIAPGRGVVLVYGGSMGSRSINRLIVKSLPALAEFPQPITVLHATGLSAGGEYDAGADTRRLLREILPDQAAALDSGPGPDGSFRIRAGNLEYRAWPYLPNLSEYMKAAEVVVCRAGAGAIAEIMAMGKASVLIPKRGLPGDHQELNAINLAEKGGCEIVFERRGTDRQDFVEPADFLAILSRLVQSPECVARLSKQAEKQFERKFKEKILKTFRRLLHDQEADYVLEIQEPPRLKIQKQVDALVAFLLKEPPDSLYRRYYAIKMEDDLAAEDWEVVNRGIKLAGALRRIDKIPALEAHFQSRIGFIRRNVFIALRHMNHYDPSIRGLVWRGLNDSYYEVRFAAMQYLLEHVRKFVGDQEIIRRIRQLTCKRFENFEVKVWAIRLLPHLTPLDEYLDLVGPYRFARNIRLREAVLDGIRMAFAAGRIPPGELEKVRQFIKQILITTSDFKPDFSIRTSYGELYQQLSGNNHD